MTAWPKLLELIQKHWGIRTLRPLQEPALKAEMAGRDSLVVLPTGSGKSLCFQAPALLRPGLTVVVSPLIALMKDQVDGLRSMGIPAAHIDSSLHPEDKQAIVDAMRAGMLKLIYAAPERLAMDGFRSLLSSCNVSSIAVDEAHCISHWGHDFRPEYRQLGELKSWFPNVSLHGYTATATARVRDDIAQQMRLHEPEILIGDFDRPNLTFRVERQESPVFGQLLDLIRRHKGGAGIVYVIRRADAETYAEFLQQNGLRAVCYHAGLPPHLRKEAQDRFINEDADVVVATIAFGMGIDRSNVRYIIHLGMPKSLEQYQQEAGRAGRDGLPAECSLLYKNSDVMVWKRILEKSVREAEVPVAPEFLESAMQHLNAIDRYCRRHTCRHRALVSYFGQPYTKLRCHACDACMTGTTPDPDGMKHAQMILSCVARVKESFGIAHVIDVLRGETSTKVQKHDHHQLSTFGLLKDFSDEVIHMWIEQLVDQEVLVHAAKDNYQVLTLNPASWAVMRGERMVSLVIRDRPSRTEPVAAPELTPLEEELLAALKESRKLLAQANSVPPYVVFNDATLVEIARERPATAAGLLNIAGIGETKLRLYGYDIFAALDDFCQRHDLERNEGVIVPKKTKERGPPAGAFLAFPFFRQGYSIDDVMKELGRAYSTTTQYLCHFIEHEKPKSVATWVPDELYQKITVEYRPSEGTAIGPLFVRLKETIPYELIRIAVTHLRLKDSKS